MLAPMAGRIGLPSETWQLDISVRARFLSSMNDTRPRVGISSCLLGEYVRYDGGHKRSDWLTGALGRYLEWVPVCPEVELGLGTPRAPIRLVERHGDVRFVQGDADLTEEMKSFAARRVFALTTANLSGYIFKMGSPSCGTESVPLFSTDGTRAGSGRGLFADELMRSMPNLPVEDEGRLRDDRLRANFLECVFAYSRLRSLFGGVWEARDLIAFHTAHKPALMAHSQAGCGELERMLASAADMEGAELHATYETAFMATLKKPAAVRNHLTTLHRAR
jgi:uncharacterized protein YbbK (DUF523 family)